MDGRGVCGEHQPWADLPVGCIASIWKTIFKATLDPANQKEAKSLRCLDGFFRTVD